MDKAGAQEMIVPTLHPLELWKETNRTNSVGFELMKIKDRREAEFALGGTAEEMFVDVVRGFKLSYKDLPFNLYQFSTKFRDEIRASGGLLRTREFVMKDAYSFDQNKEEFEKEYQKMWQTYEKIFHRFGLEAKAVKSDNGYIGGEYCHEFIVESEVGESKFLESEDGSYRAHEDVAEFLREDINSGEEIKKMEIIKQPEWVKTMDDNEKHYKLPKARFLKNVVYKNRLTGEIIIAVIRGDLEVNKTKLEHVLDVVGQLEDANGEDLKEIGTKPGYVHSWGHKKARYVGDISLTTVRNFVGGQKEEEKDTINVNYGRDFECEKLADIALAKAGYKTKDGKQVLKEKIGIEVGNIFQLGYHYSKKMKDAHFIDTDGKTKPYYMGCYGIGIGRNIATIAEMHHDEKGLIWPKEIAPFQIHLTALNLEKSEVKEAAEELYKKFIEEKVEVLYDDRQESPGVKLNDADLIGIPTRVLISSKSLGKGEVEVTDRKSGNTRMVQLKNVTQNL